MLQDIFVLFLIIFTVFALAIAGISIKSFFKKDGKFTGGCASNNPMLVNEIGECTVCGDVPGDSCDTGDASGSLPKVGA